MLRRSRYRSSILVGKIKGIVVVGVWPVFECFDGSDKVSGNDKEAPDGIFYGVVN